MISVIVPVYMVEPYLRQCVESILNQTYRDLEILLIDDGSPDRCGAMCDEFAQKDSRVRVFHTENRGLSAARNLGLREAKGEYIGFVDSDDWIEPDMYQKLLNRIQEAGADMSSCEYIMENEIAPKRTSERKSSEGPQILTGLDPLRSLIDGYTYNKVMNKLYCRELFDSVSFPEGKKFEDIATTYKLLAKTRCLAVSPEKEYHYRIRENSICRISSAKNLIDGAEAMIVRYDFLRDNFPELFIDCEKKLLSICTGSISEVWFWWYGWRYEEKQRYRTQIEELKKFSREHFSPFMPGTISMKIRFSIIFMRYSSRLSFGFLYMVNSICRLLKRR